ncbi:30S ribosomal protein S5 [Candidatus Roizmanbacteria bacterium]|nr:30S ribosomal protein S5 [Candidatus Roizmanbacteria bacterium]
MAEEIKEEPKLEERVLLIRRVSKKTPGGNYITFSALVAVGDRKGRLGIGLGRSQEVPPAIKKAIAYAKKHMITVALYKSTIPHEISIKYKASKVLLKPAPEGTGLKVGSVARALLEVAGVKDVSGKIIRSRNQISNTYAILKALEELKAKK